ncbi:nucleoside/nucleotide kinase family protein [Streptomyces marincola]|uniref:hypothetical protein n=1 Tax=Streptomyces marincola TaxID=2878388 RepID=UPI001CF29C03|nr:hypothetical protein [Streptomyces marincola]UCM86668.1 hypothetical protein LC193_01225 [Streptomyces marincola]
MPPTHGPALPVLWLCGPPGVGKSTVAWHTFRAHARSGTRTAYADIDQLGIAFPEPPDDPGRHRLKARNLRAVLAAARAAGARRAVVSGVVDPAHGPHTAELAGTAPTVVRLRADRAELGRRFLGRGDPPHSLDAVLAEAGILDRSTFADATLDTTGLHVTEVVRRVRARAAAHPARPAAAPPPAIPGTAPGGPVLWLSGTRGTGKSAVGWEVFQTLLRAGVAAAFIDLEQIGFLSPAPADDPGNLRLSARNLAALWTTYRAAGAQALVVVGTDGSAPAVAHITAALPEARFTLRRLHAGPGRITRRVFLRGAGHGPALPGDPLRGKPEPYLARAARGARAEAAARERTGPPVPRVRTDDHSAAETARMILAATGWPGLLTVRPPRRA